MANNQDRAGRQPGIRDVARAAGVSVASASFALNGQPGVADHTRRRILAAAARLDYRANPQAQALRRGRTTTYGILVRNFANPFFLEVVGGAEEAAALAGVTLLALDSHYSLEREHKQVQQMAAQLLAGLAIAPVGTGESIKVWQGLRPGAPVVALNASPECVSGVTRVLPDNRAAVDLAVRRLAALGHTRIAFLAAPRHLMPDPDRLAHFHRLTTELNLCGHVIYSPLTICDVRASVGALLAAPGAPTAVVTSSDYTAHGVYKAARDHGMRIGADVSVVGHDDLPTSELLDPPLATIALDGREMGRALMARLLDETLQDDYIAPVHLVERASLHGPEIPAPCAVHQPVSVSPGARTSAR
jgi:LacI family transcriptional regulator